MKENQIRVKKIQNGRETRFTIKNGMVYNAMGSRQVYCGCTGNTEETATPMQYENGEVFCPNCHEKKVEVLETYSEWKARKDEEERIRNEEQLANLHIVEMGSDWECGFKFYGLSARIEYQDWLKIKEHFKYYNRGWSRGQELEWNYGEPTGWLTTDPQAVEDILVENGLIKSENTMEAIRVREEAEKERARIEREEKEAKRAEIKEQMDALDEQIRDAFDEDYRALSDAEATHHYGGKYRRNNTCTYDVTDDEIIKCNNMGDFTYAVAIPYSEDVENLIMKVCKLNVELLGV